MESEESTYVKPKRKRKAYNYTYCKEANCKTVANYGYSYGVKEYCCEHKLSGMINKSILKCKNELCQRFASYGLDGKRHYCSYHKTPEMEMFNGGKNYKEKKRKLEELENEAIEILEIIIVKYARIE